MGAQPTTPLYKTKRTLKNGLRFCTAENATLAKKNIKMLAVESPTLDLRNALMIHDFDFSGDKSDGKGNKLRTASAD